MQPVQFYRANMHAPRYVGQVVGSCTRSPPAYTVHSSQHTQEQNKEYPQRNQEEMNPILRLLQCMFTWRQAVLLPLHCEVRVSQHANATVLWQDKTGCSAD
jgi:hypothetical protein